MIRILIKIPLMKNFLFLRECLKKSHYLEGDKFPLVYAVISLYVTYITEEPIHHVGSEFPGNLKVEKINGEYFCPVKEKHMDNVNATCHYCIAKQNPDVWVIICFSLNLSGLQKPENSCTKMLKKRVWNWIISSLFTNNNFSWFN